MSIINKGKQRNVSVDTLMRRKAFTKGFNDRLKGLPWDGERYTCSRDNSNYERGRQFAIIWPRPLKNGKQLCQHAARAFVEAMRNREIV